MKKIQLTSVSRLPKASGEPGDVVTVSDEIAERMIAGRGAVAVPAEKKVPAKKSQGKKDSPAS